MNDDVKQSSIDRYAVSQAYRWRAERDIARQELEKVKSKQLSMISDDERREVARRLRKTIGLTEFAEALGFNWNDGSDWGWKDVSNLVADLIEPSESRQNRDRNQDTVQKESPVVQIEHECDRDALLALADEMDERAPYGWYSGERDSLRDYARRIREALGVVE